MSDSIRRSEVFADDDPVPICLTARKLCPTKLDPLSVCRMNVRAGVCRRDACPADDVKALVFALLASVLASVNEIVVILLVGVEVEYELSPLSTSGPPLPAPGSGADYAPPVVIAPPDIFFKVG
ncbi:hypothetical protein EVAR_90949_1 [Eumeta japonica]|uniref:Uncharacterized protein n=1 Tax=Eumeta variegata TaxID=151549 RepID=A0A4C1SM83_EUMVA|nr:hypothetical protein EVAR_90949_1 [Eumeta japonica]